MSGHLDDREREILLRLVSDALEERPSAIKELVNESRPRLYVIFAKLSGALEAEATPRGDELLDASERWSDRRARALGNG